MPPFVTFIFITIELSRTPMANLLPLTAVAATVPVSTVALTTVHVNIFCIVLKTAPTNVEVLVEILMTQDAVGILDRIRE